MSALKLKHRVILSLSLVACFACQSSAAWALDEKVHAEADAVAAPDDSHALSKTAASAASSGLLAEPKAGAASVGPHAGSGQHDTTVPMKLQTDLALWTLVTFLCFLFVMKKFAWGPMIQGLDKREEGIRKAISDAEEGRRKSQALLAEYDQKLKAAEQTVAAMVAEARRDAERTGQDLIANTQREVEAIKTRAKEEILRAKDTALAEVFTQMNSQVVRATEHVLGRALQDADQDRLVGEALAKIGR